MTLAALKPVYRKYAVEIIVLLIGLAAMTSIFLAGAFRGSTVTREAAGQLGDFVGGFVGAGFSLIGIVLLIRTLVEQRTSSNIQSFENKYFELLKLHRDNVTEIDLPGASGRKLFVVLLRELRAAHDILDDVASERSIALSPSQRLHIAYYCVFFGVGPNSSRMLKQALSEFQEDLIEALESRLNDESTKAEVRDRLRLQFTPFEGHQSRLGHYYRHLYQMVKYVHRQSLDIDKYEHVKTVRAQLSTHEQAMLLINSLTPMGRVWWKEELIKTYRLVQNLPRQFFDPSGEIDTKALFPRGYFEWEERPE
jgi:hypothetical protein